MRTVSVILGLLCALAQACVTAPPGSYSHSRFVRATPTEPAPNVGFTTDALFEKDSVALPQMHGTVAHPLSPAYDTSVVVADGMLMYEGLVRFEGSRRIGILHGAGLGVMPDLPGKPDQLRANVGAVAGLFGQVGPSLYGAATYSMLAVNNSGYFKGGHFVSAEVGYVFGTRMRFAPTVRTYTPLFGDLVEVEDFPDLSFLLGLSIQAGY